MSALPLPPKGNARCNTPDMKLLFDQNISPRVLRLLPKDFSASRQVRSIGLNECTDIEILQYAKKNGYTLVTFDVDFFDASILQDIPTKIVWLRTVGLTSSDIAERIINFSSHIALLIDSERSCLEIV